MSESGAVPVSSESTSGDLLQFGKRVFAGRFGQTVQSMVPKWGMGDFPSFLGEPGNLSIRSLTLQGLHPLAVKGRSMDTNHLEGFPILRNPNFGVKTAVLRGGDRSINFLHCLNNQQDLDIVPFALFECPSSRISSKEKQNKHAQTSQSFAWGRSLAKRMCARFGVVCF